MMYNTKRDLALFPTEEGQRRRILNIKAFELGFIREIASVKGGAV